MKMKMRRLVTVLVLVCVLLCGCETHSSLTYNFDVDGGFKYAVTVNTSGEYKAGLSEDKSRIEYSNEDGDDLGIFFFIDPETYDYYYENIYEADDTEVYEEGSTEAYEYFMYAYDGDVYYVMYSDDWGMGAAIMSSEEPETVVELAKRTTIAVR